MVTLATQVCLVLSALYSLVCSQPQQPTDPGNPFGQLAGAAPQPTDPNLGNPFGQLGGSGGTLDPNFIPNFGTAPTDPNAFPNLGNPGFTGPYPAQPAPLPRPNPLQSVLPFMMFRGGGDMAQMFAMMSMMGGGGGLASNPFLLLSLLGNSM